MRKGCCALLLLASLYAPPVFAQPHPVPDRICVPAALLDRLVANVAAEPWSAATATMDAVREFSRAPAVPCPPPAQTPPPPDKDKQP